MSTARMVGEIRTRNNYRQVHEKRDLALTESLYQLVPATDAVLKSLTADQKQLTLQNSDCVGAHIKSVVKISLKADFGRQACVDLRDGHRYAVRPRWISMKFIHGWWTKIGETLTVISCAIGL